MQKSKIVTILIILLIFIYTLLGQTQFYKLGNTYTYIINPLFWIVLCLAIKVIWLPTYNVKKLKKEIIEYVLITVLVYVILYLLSGLFVDYGKNPYKTTFKGLLLNIITMGGVIAAREYVRYRLIHNVYQKDKKLIEVLIVLVFSLVEINILEFAFAKINAYFIFKQVFYKVVPVLIKNILFTYITYKTDYTATIVYDIGIKLMLWISPILPKTPWVMDAITDSVFPIILLLYIRYTVNKKSRFTMEREIGERYNPTGLIPLSIILVLLIWFALGLFPIRPVGVATGSMNPNLKIGDVAIIKKCTPNDVVVGDIIEYQMDGYTVIHRVVNIYQKNGEFFFITKGDFNKNEDKLPVSEDQLIGKTIFKIKYLALPAIWVHNLSSQTVVEVETGK